MYAGGSLDVSDRFTSWSFELSLSNFSLFCLFSQNLVRLLSGSILKKLFLAAVLNLESFQKNLFELDFSIFKKTLFYGQTFSGR